jgi:hypothetical protein
MSLLSESKKEKERNFKDNLNYIDFYADWIKKTPNKVWSKQQKQFIDSVYKSIPSNVVIKIKKF